MSLDDRDLNDDALRRALHEALGGERAPETWVRDALAVSGRRPAVVRRGPLLPLLLPHLAGLALLLGILVSVLLNPTVFDSGIDAFRAVLPRGPIPDSTSRLLDAGCATTLAVFFLFQGARGFPILRRLRHGR